MPVNPILQFLTIQASVQLCTIVAATITPTIPRPTTNRGESETPPSPLLCTALDIRSARARPGGLSPSGSVHTWSGGGWGAGLNRETRCITDPIYNSTRTHACTHAKLHKHMDAAGCRVQGVGYKVLGVTTDEEDKHEVHGDRVGLHRHAALSDCACVCCVMHMHCVCVCTSARACVCVRAFVCFLSVYPHAQAAFGVARSTPSLDHGGMRDEGHCTAR